LETDFVKVIGVSDGGTASEAGAGGIGFFSVADAGSFLSFVVEETSRDFDRDDADGEMEGFGVDTVAGGATGEACWAGGLTAGWRPVSFSSSVNRLSADPGPSPTSILEKSPICDLVEAHPPLKTKAPITRTVQATAHMAFTIPPCKRLIIKKEITKLACFVFYSWFSPHSLIL
jgi:hypothetical protein